MCLAVPAKVTKKLNDFNAEVEYMGSSRSIGISLVPGVKEGDWVLVHAGYALEIVDEEFAKESLELWREIDHAMGTP